MTPSAHDHSHPELDQRLRETEGTLGRHDERIKVLEKGGESSTMGRRFFITLTVSLLMFVALVVFQVVNLVAGG